MKAGDPVVGDCMQMCPNSEIDFRAANNLLSVFEAVSPTSSAANSSRTVVSEHHLYALISGGIL